MLPIGLWRLWHGSAGPAPVGTMSVGPGLDTLELLLLAFASGCAALTGIEAISNGVPSFRPPESRNAAVTLIWMAIVCLALFLGITFLAQWLPHHAGRPRWRDRALQARTCHLRDRVLLPRPPARHYRRPGLGRQHRLCRLSAARLHPRPGRLRPPPARQPRRPARLLQRHRRPGNLFRIAGRGTIAA